VDVLERDFHSSAVRELQATLHPGRPLHVDERSIILTNILLCSPTWWKNAAVSKR